MITRTSRNLPDHAASARAELLASEALPLDDPGQATLLARAQVWALLSLGDEVGGLASSTGDVGTEIGTAIEGLTESRATR